MDCWGDFNYWYCLITRPIGNIFPNWTNFASCGNIATGEGREDEII